MIAVRHADRMHKPTSLDDVMTATVKNRIVVQVAAKDKRALAAKARRLGVSIPELMRRGALAYAVHDGDEELDALADAANAAADRAVGAIVDALTFIAISNKRIAALEVNAAKRLLQQPSGLNTPPPRESTPRASSIQNLC